MSVQVGRWCSMVIVWAGVLMAGIGFCLPWVQLDLRTSRLDLAALDRVAGRLGAPQAGRVTLEIHRGTKTMATDLSALTDIPTSVRGLEIPHLVHEERTQVALALVELVTGTRHDLGWKAQLVYLVPIIACCCGLLILWYGHFHLVDVSVALAAIALTGVAWWKLSTLLPRAHWLSLRVGVGLHLSMAAYLAIATGALLRALIPSTKT